MPGNRSKPVWLTYQHQMPSVTIDLLELRIEPAEFDIERNRILAEMCRRTLLRNAGQLAPPGAVASAVLFAHFGIDDYSEDGRSASIGRSIFTVILTDDRGKKWKPCKQEATMPKIPGSHHVVPNANGGWDVKKVTRSSGHFDKKQDAVDAGRKISQNQGTEFYIHGKDGKIQDKDSHGNDPYPPKG